MLLNEQRVHVFWNQRPSRDIHRYHHITLPVSCTVLPALVSLSLTPRPILQRRVLLCFVTSRDPGMTYPLGEIALVTRTLIVRPSPSPCSASGRRRYRFGSRVLLMVYL